MSCRPWSFKLLLHWQPPTLSTVVSTVGTFTEFCNWKYSLMSLQYPCCETFKVMLAHLCQVSWLLWKSICVHLTRFPPYSARMEYHFLYASLPVMLSLLKAPIYQLLFWWYAPKFSVARKQRFRFRCRVIMLRPQHIKNRCYCSYTKQASHIWSSKRA